jgi:O-antigen/teichoic acid export membrane protein
VAVPVSAINYFGPVLALQMADGLVPVAAVLVLSRAAAFAAYLALALRALPPLRVRPVFRPRLLPPLLAFGGWISVSQVVSPLMLYADRFVVGALLSTVAVARYATPQEAILRLGALSGAVTAVLFPAFAAAREPGRAAGLMARGVAAVFILCFPVTVLAGAFASEVLNAWLGPDYAAQGAAVLRWLAVGLLVNGLAKVPAAFLAAGGRPDLPARLHLVELPVYAALVWGLTAAYGLPGAAAAWVARAAADAAALYWLAGRQLPAVTPAAAPAALVALSGAMAVATLAAITDPAVRAALAAVVLVGGAALAWICLLGEEGRAAVRGTLGGRRPSA